MALVLQLLGDLRSVERLASILIFFEDFENGLGGHFRMWSSHKMCAATSQNPRWQASNSPVCAERVLLKMRLEAL